MLRAAETVQRTDTGRHRRGNEDASYARAPVFVLADGMGGARAGEVASHLAVEAFERGLPSAGTPEERLAVVVQRANKEIYDRSQTEASHKGMGTTVTAVYLDAEAVSLAHVGDSRAYRLRGGELMRLTDDHSLVGDLLRDGKLTEDEAFEHPQRSIITRALGQEPVVDVDTFSYPVRAGDVFLLCSDGLTDMLPERQVAEMLVAAPNLESAAKRLVDEANEAGGRDNITVVLFRVEDAGAGSSVPPAEQGDDQHTMYVPGGALAPDGSDTPGSDEQAGKPGESRASGSEGAKPGTPAPVSAPQLEDHEAKRAAGAGESAARQAPQVTVPLAPTQGAPRKQRKFGVVGKLVAFVTSLAIVLFLVCGGAYIASRQLYFIGTNAQGTVVLYRGFPYQLPFNIPLYESFYTSGTPASAIPVGRRGTILNHGLHNQGDGIKLVNDLELSKISG